MVFYAAVILEQSVGLEHKVALVTAGCVNFAFAVGCIAPILGLDKLGRRPLLMIGTAGQAISMAIIAALLSFEGTAKQQVTATASIAFFITVSFPIWSAVFAFSDNISQVHDLLRIKPLPYPVALCCRDHPSAGQRARHSIGSHEQLGLGKSPLTANRIFPD